MQNIQYFIITESSFSYLWPACEKKSSSDISIFLLYYFLKASHTFHSRFHKHLKRWYFLIYATVHLQTWRCCTLLGSECVSFNLIYAIKVYHHVRMDDLESAGWKNTNRLKIIGSKLWEDTHRISIQMVWNPGRAKDWRITENLGSSQYKYAVLPNPL